MTLTGRRTLSTCSLQAHGPRGGLEQTAIPSTLQAEGFDRSVLPAAWALEKFRACWEDKSWDQPNAIPLAETYRAIGKPTSAWRIHQGNARHAPG